MTLQQLNDLKRWHVLHRREHPIELALLDGVLSFWVMGWIGVPAAIAIGEPLALLLSLTLVTMPRGYVAARARLHRAGRLRCDWIGVVPRRR